MIVKMIVIVESVYNKTIGLLYKTANIKQTTRQTHAPSILSIYL